MNELCGDQASPEAAAHDHHDCGGKPAGPVDVVHHDATHWELRVDAVYQLLADSRRNILRADELRWMRESLSAEDYDRFNYYERWVAAMSRILVSKQIVTQDELAAKMDEIRSRKTE
ncbi:hypothetical protein ACSBOB_09670 [Mesorhizobium sp. ASY16-5R]|uniref:hypothetical protein n=1 Tax=Mesorhizobium sp. ASY16-5R TaxID=3445772 RepID=UPI003F9EE6F2